MVASLGLLGSFCAHLEHGVALVLRLLYPAEPRNGGILLARSEHELGDWAAGGTGDIDKSPVKLPPLPTKGQSSSSRLQG